MQDLNELFFFAAVVANGGFAPAGRALRQPKSKLSRRVAQLEARLGVRLIERSTRRFRVTEVGQAFYERCRSVMTEVEQADAVVAEAKAEPHGIVRFSCPTGLIEAIARILPEFMLRHPRIRLQVVATNRRVDLIEQRIDVALRVRVKLDTDAALTMRTLVMSRRILVASPALGNRLGNAKDVGAVGALPTLSTDEEGEDVVWDLVGPEGEVRSVRHEPRLACSDLTVLREAAVAGLGIALLPEHTCAPAFRDGKLVRVFPEWQAPDGTIHLVFTTRRGLPPAVRALIDHIAEHFRDEVVT
jgi:DNA-binding transcriptional LysR family regulator